MKEEYCTKQEMGMAMLVSFAIGAMLGVFVGVMVAL